MTEHRVEGFSLSPQQRHLWPLAQRGFVTFSQGVVSIPCDVRADRVERALLQSVKRHEILRTGFETLPGMNLALQVVHPEPYVRFEAIDTPHSLTADAATEGLLRQHREASFDLVHGPWMRATLQSCETESRLVITVPGMCADADSLAFIARDVARAYVGNGAAEPDNTLQYADYAEWHNEWLESADSAADREAWRRRPLPDGATIWLTGERGIESAAPVLGTATMDAGASHERVELAARGLHVRVEDVLLAVWAALICRLADRSDIAIGVRLGGRRADRLEQAVGAFGRHIPVALRCDPSASLAETVRRVAHAVTVAEGMQESFTWDLVVPPASTAAPHRVVPFGFSHVTTGRALLADPGWRIVHQDAVLDLFRVELGALVQSGRIRLRLRFDVNGSTETWAAELLDRYRRLLSAAIERPTLRLDSVDLSSEREREWVAAWNRTSITRAPAGDIATWCDRFAATMPQRPAVVAENGVVSWADLAVKSNRLAHHLKSVGVGADVPVAICLDRTSDAVVSALGVLKAGGAFLPLDPSYPHERLQSIVGDAGARVVITRQQWADAFLGQPVHIVALDGDAAALASWPEDGPRPLSSSSRLAYIIYTSGSTGAPKGVAIEHRSLMNLITALRHALDVGGGTRRVGLLAPLTFDASIKQLFQLAWGDTVYLLPESLRTDPHGVLAYAAEHRLDVLDCTPSLLRLLLDAGLDRDPGWPRAVLVGGEAIEPRLWARLASARSFDAWNLYGPTECTVDATACHIDDETPHIGRPLPHCQAYVLDQAMQVRPRGAVGELYIGGAGVGRGYVGRPAATAAAFRPDPFANEPGARLYRTGDMARHREDGRLEYIGRRDTQVKLRGYRVELGEIEARLQAHPGVRSAAVTVRSDASAAPALVAYVALRESPVPPSRVRHLLPNGMTVTCDDRAEAEYLYREIFEHQTYLRNGLDLPGDACVVDVGANIGMFTAFAGTRCPDGRIYACEPIPSTFEALRENASLARAPVVLLPIGLGDREEIAEFTHYPRYPAMSGLARYAATEDDIEVVQRCLANDNARGRDIDELAGHADALLGFKFSAERVMSRVRRLSDVIREEAIEQIDLLKIDAQRAELDVLRGIDDEDWPKIQQIALEVHDRPDRETRDRVMHVMLLLRERGFDVHTEQEASLRGTDRHMVYARRRVIARPAGRVQPETAAARPRAEGPITAAVLRHYLERSLPAFMIPQMWVFLDRLPLTASGKVDRAALPAPDAASSRASRYVAPRTPREALIAGIWSSVLKQERVGVHDNFFELGGDSILTIRAVARCNEAGLSLTPLQVFEHPTVAELAQLTGPAADARPRHLTGPVALTPIQARFFERQLTHPEQFTQSVLLVPHADLDRLALAQAVEHVFGHHDAFGLRFTKADGRWVQAHAGSHARPRVFAHVDMSALPARGVRNRVVRIGTAIAASLDLAAGPLARVVLIEATAEDRRVLAVSHHLVVDAVSWRILLDQLGQAYRGLRNQRTVPRLPATASFDEWSRALNSHLASIDAREREYWLAMASSPAPPLPRHRYGPNTAGSSSVATATLGRPVVAGPIAANGAVRFLDRFVTAVVCALCEWSRTDTLVIDLEHHGRTSLPIDTSHTIGWLATICPVAVRVDAPADLERSLAAIAGQLRGLPQQGLGYGLLRYLSSDEKNAPLRRMPHSEVVINYLGEFDTDLAQSDMFSLASESSGPSQHPDDERAYLLEFSGAMVNGRLQVTCGYSRNVHDSDTIDALLRRVCAALTALAGSAEPAAAEPDLYVAGIDDGELDAVLAHVEAAPKR